jgi:hypothetical protein
MTMLGRQKYRRYLLAASVTALALLVALSLLPDDKYIRYRQVGGDGQKAGWIYERLHFDPEPVDVAFLGTSHTMRAVDAERIEAGLRGVRVASLAMPYHGQNLAYVLAKELFANKRVRLVVLEVREIQSRAGHDMFWYLADREDIVSPVWLFNPNAITDLAHLPGRQLRLFFRGLFPDAFGEPRAFDPAHYAGHHWSDAADHIVTHPREWLEAEHANELRTRSYGALPASLHPLEFRFSTEYTNRIKALAAANGTAVAFLYLPSYSETAPPADRALYDDLWTPPAAVLAPPERWADLTHLNAAGANALVPWLTDQIALALARDIPGTADKN